MHLAFQLLQVNMLCCNDFQINRLHYCKCISTSMHTGLPCLHKENNSNLFFLEMPHFASFLFSLDCVLLTTPVLHRWPTWPWSICPPWAGQGHWKALKAFHWPVSTNSLFISFLILFLLDCICKLRWWSDKKVLRTMAQKNGPSHTSIMRFTMFNLEQGPLHPCGRYFDMYHLPKKCCRPCTPFHGTDISWWLWPLSPGRVPCHEAKTVQEWFSSAPASQFTGLRGSAANMLEPVTTAHLHSFSRVNTSTGQSCFNSKCGTKRILMLNEHHNAMPDWFMISSCEISGQ